VNPIVNRFLEGSCRSAEVLFMKIALLGAISFAFLFATGQGLLVASPEPIRLSLWGVALLSLSSGAKAWLVHKNDIHRARQASGEASGLREAAAEMLAQTRA
jgi:hypothetical protein